MNKLERFYSDLEKNQRGVLLPSGEYGYFVTLGELLQNNGKNEFFRIVRASKVGKNVFYGLEYDKSEKAYFANCFSDISKQSKPLNKNTMVFIGFTF